MKTLKRMFAGLVSLIMVFSLFSVMPVMAAGEETETETIEFADIFEQARYETNLVVNGSVEEELDFEGSAPNWHYRYDNPSSRPTYERRTEQAYSGDYSLLSTQISGKSDYIAPLARGFRKNTTYITSAMILSTVANKVHSDAYAGYNLGWGSYVKFYDFSVKASASGEADKSVVVVGGPSQTQMKDVPHVASASSDENGVKSDHSDWVRYHTLMTVKDGDVGALACGFNMAVQTSGLTTDEQKYLEFYIDDYYIGELIVADIVNETPTTINVPAYGSTTVDLKATAYNQIENTVGLTDAEYTWELINDVDGAYIENNKLVITDELVADELTLRVICIPKFFGADTQNDELTKYRSKEFTFTVVDCFETLRNSTNLIPSTSSPDVESDKLWADNQYKSYCYFTPSYQRKESYAISANQAYNGNQSLLINHPSGATLNESHFPGWYSIKYGKTLVASAMILGTDANAATCEANPETNAALKLGTYNTTYFNTLPGQFVLSGNSVKLNTMLDVSSAEKASKDKWQMVHTGMAIQSAADYGSRYWTGAGVVINGGDIELFADDYYIGELVVAKVKGTTEKAYITSEENTVELTAETYNQLGTTDYFGENTTYTWTATSLPEGVELVDGKLVIAPTAKEGQAVLNVTVTPDFMGADEQTAEQKAYRTATVTVDIVDQTRFTFAEADGKITATAVAGELDKNAKIYCALYKVQKDVETEKEILKLMDVEIKDLVPNGENVTFTAIDKPDYDYEIKCFMIDINKLEAIIPATIK